MKAGELLKVLQSLDPKKRIKFQNSEGWGRKTMAVNAIIEQGDVYILIWACHPYCIKEDLKEGQNLVWYNPKIHNADLVTKYFPDYGTTSKTVNKSKEIPREELLTLDTTTYNMAMELQWNRDKVKKNLSGDLNVCEDCGRKYVLCCICDDGQKRFNDMLTEVKEVSNQNNNN